MQPVGNVLLEVMDDLRACLCERLEEPCYCGLYPGSQAAADFCDCKGAGACGMAWVRLDRIYPSRQFPTPDTTGFGAGTVCGPVLAAVIELGVLRCLPTGDARGGAPTAVQQATAVQSQTEDAMAMAAAFGCCDSLTKRPKVLGTYTPTPTSGGCGGGTWPVTVWLVRA